MKPTSSFHSNHDIPNVQQDKQPCINAQVNTKINSQSRWIYPKCEGNILIYIYICYICTYQNQIIESPSCPHCIFILSISIPRKKIDTFYGDMTRGYRTLSSWGYIPMFSPSSIISIY